jgi:hypothetical protein
MGRQKGSNGEDLNVNPRCPGEEEPIRNLPAGRRDLEALESALSHLDPRAYPRIESNARANSSKSFLSFSRSIFETETFPALQVFTRQVVLQYRCHLFFG